MDAPILTKERFDSKYFGDIYDPESGDPYGQTFALPIAGSPEITHDCLVAFVYTQKNGKYMLAINNYNTCDTYKVIKNFSDRNSAIACAYDWVKANIGDDFYAYYSETE